METAILLTSSEESVGSHSMNLTVSGRFSEKIPILPKNHGTPDNALPESGRIIHPP